MKKVFGLVLAALMLISPVAQAATWRWGGTLMGNVCRSGGWYFVFSGSGYPVGSTCWFTIPAGSFQDIITNE